MRHGLYGSKGHGGSQPDVYVDGILIYGLFCAKRRNVIAANCVFYLPESSSSLFHSIYRSVGPQLQCCTGGRFNPSNPHNIPTESRHGAWLLFSGGCCLLPLDGVGAENNEICVQFIQHSSTFDDFLLSTSSHLRRALRTPRRGLPALFIARTKLTFRSGVTTDNKQQRRHEEENISAQDNRRTFPGQIFTVCAPTSSPPPPAQER